MGVSSRKFVKFIKFIKHEHTLRLMVMTVCLAAPFVLSAQNNANDVTIKKNGKKYVRHIVGKGETVYGVAEKYNEQPKDIIFENPKAIDGIHPGDTLLIPVIVKAADTSSVKGNFIYHDVVGKETLYSLSKRYNTTVGAIDSLNPGLAGEGLKAGERIRIPAASAAANNKSPGKNPSVKDTIVTQVAPKQDNTSKTEVRAFKALIEGNQPQQVPANNMAVSYKDTGKKMSRYNVAFIMPFTSEGTDTLRLGRLLEGTEKIPLITQISVDFYHGMMVALDSLSRKGLKVNLHVYNISSVSDSSSFDIDSILRKPELLNMNLIIGPPYPTHFVRIARFAGIHRIPIVSPLSSESYVLKNNPWTSKIIPSALTETEREADYIAAHYNHNNIIVIHNRDANQKYYMAFKKRFHQTDSALGNKDTLRTVESLGGVNGLATKISNTEVNIIMMPYEGAPFVAKFVNELANSRYAHRDSIIVFGMHNWANNDALAAENLDTLGLHFPSNEYVDYANAPTKKFILKYRVYYLSEPSYFSYEGYDATLFYGTLLQLYGTDLQEHLGDMKYRGLQTSFNMVRMSATAGYENNAVYILEYSNYTVKPDLK